MQENLAKTAVVPFVYKDSLVRTITDNKNESWFCLKDVCSILGIGNPSDVVKRLDKKGVERVETLTAGGVQILNYINEPNLYRTIFRSDKPDAVNFQAWVFDVVLPQIRKTGSYSVITRLDENAAIQNAIRRITEDYSRTLEILGITGNANTNAVNNKIKQLTAGAEDPLGSTGNTYLIADTQEQLFTPTEIGKKVGLSAVNVNKRLIEAQFQIAVEYKGKKTYELTEKGKEFGQYLDTGKKHSNGQPIRSVKWSGSLVNVHYIWQ